MKKSCSKNKKATLAQKKLKILELIKLAQGGDANAISKLESMQNNRNYSRLLLSLIEEENTKHLKGYTGANYQNYLNITMWPYKK
jgi:hypothetical protein